MLDVAIVDSDVIEAVDVDSVGDFISLLINGRSAMTRADLSDCS